MEGVERVKFVRSETGKGEVVVTLDAVTPAGQKLTRLTQANEPRTFACNVNRSTRSKDGKLQMASRPRTDVEQCNLRSCGGGMSELVTTEALVGNDFRGLHGPSNILRESSHAKL